MLASTLLVYELWIRLRSGTLLKLASFGLILLGLDPLVVPDAAAEKLMSTLIG